MAVLQCPNMSYVRVCHILGNGDIDKGRAMLFRVADRLEAARGKHRWPDEAYGKYQALGVIGSEFRELEKAVEKESPERQEDEALDVIATALRFLGNEHAVPEGACNVRG